MDKQIKSCLRSHNNEQRSQLFMKCIQLLRIFSLALMCLVLVDLTMPALGVTQITPELVASEVQTPQQVPPTGIPEKSRNQEFVEALGALLSSVSSNEAKLVQFDRELARAATDDERARIQNDIKITEGALKNQRQSLQAIASGLSSTELKPGTEQKVDWQAELQAFLWPIFRELQYFTQRPREIEAYRTEITNKQSMVDKIDQALQRIHDLAETTTVRRIDGYLDVEKKRLLEQKAQLENDISVANLQLQETLNDKKSLAETISSLFGMFFKTRGKNLLIAIGSFLLVFICLRGLHVLFRQRVLYGRFRRDGFAVRLLDISINAFIVIISVSTGLMTLYVSGDWVLLGLAIILVVSAAWSAKQGLGAFFEQAKLILNLGAVREGERIMYNGLPYRVERLHYYTSLSNPALTGSHLRVRLDDLIQRTSRPYGKEEIWFPTAPGDWVHLNDDTFGQIASQTPDYVVLTMFGNTTKTYITTDFLAKEPANLSKGFRVNSIFGVDYRHQADVTTAIPERLEAAIRAAFIKAGYERHLVSLLVDFKEAGASSLDILMYAAFTGDIAPDCFTLTRIMQKTAVNTATTCGWVIPFPQLTVEPRFVPDPVKTEDKQTPTS